MEEPKRCLILAAVPVPEPNTILYCFNRNTDHGSWAIHPMQAPQIPEQDRMVLPPAEAIRKFHTEVPLIGDTLGNLLSFPDDVLLYVVAGVRNTPRAPPVNTRKEWDHLIEILRRHRIIFLMRSHISTWPEPCRPPREASARIDRIFFRGAARNLLIGQRVQPVFSALQDAGIPVLLIKGQALARTIYKDPALRQSYDVDILVQPEHADACDRVLRALGYSCPVRNFANPQSEVHHDNYSLPMSGVKIEMHWTPSYSLKIFPDDWLSGVFARKIPIRSSDISCYTLDPMDHLLYLIFHTIVQHKKIRIDWICDLAYLMDALLQVPENWERLRSECAGMHMAVPLQLALTTADLWCGVKVPVGSPGFAPALPPSAEDIRIWEESRKRKRYKDPSLYDSLRKIPGIRNKLVFLSWSIFPPVERLGKYRYSPSAIDIPLAYLRRWIDLIRSR